MLITFIVQLVLAFLMTFAIIHFGSKENTSTSCRSARCWAKIFISAMFRHKNKKH